MPRYRASPIALAIVMALVALRPVLQDRCLLACAGESSASTPSCHHATEAHGDRLETRTQGCEHDHGAVILGANASTAYETSLNVSAESVSIDDIVARSRSRFHLHAPPPIASGRNHAVSQPLRL